MDQASKENIVNQCLVNRWHFFYDNDFYYVSNPSREVICGLELEYEKLRKTLFFIEECTIESCEDRLVRGGIINDTYTNKIELLSKSMENVRVNLYKQYMNFPLRGKIKGALDRSKLELNNLYNQRWSLETYLKPFILSNFRSLYVFCCGVYKQGRIFTEWGSADPILLEGMFDAYSRSLPSLPDMRDICRTEPWRAVWSVGKPNPFSSDLSSLNSIQQTLLRYSQLYDSAYQSVDCPHDDVIKDDDAFDGWLVHRHREMEQKKNESQIDETLGKNKGAEEVFIPVTSSEEADKINNMNDARGKAVQAQRKEMIKKHKEVSLKNMPDMAQKIRMAQTQAYVSKMKG